MNIMHFFQFLLRKQEDVSELIRRLSQVEKVDPSPEFLERSRAHLLAMIQSAGVREEPRTSDLFSWAHFLFGTRRARPFGRQAWALMVLFVFIVVVGVPFTIQSPDTMLRVTYLRAFGKVKVEREGKTIPVFDQMILQEGDTVKTESDSKAEIYFLDDSVSRMAPDTEIKITTLSSSQTTEFSTSIAVNVTQGRVWSNVVSPAVDSTSFTVTAEDVSGTVDAKASFDLSVVDHDVTVLAVNNTVNLTVKEDGTVLSKVLIEGESLTLQGVSESAALLRVVRNDVSDPWIDENVKKDTSYHADLQNKYQDLIAEKAGILPGSPLYGVKKFSESATVAFTFDPVSKKQKKLEIAERRLFEAETLLSSGQTDAGRALLDEFQQSVQEDDTEYAKDLVAESLDTLLSQVKSSLEEVAVLMVSDDVKKLTLKLDLSLDMLFATRELLQTDAVFEVISENFRSYRALAEEVVADISDLSSGDRAEILSSFLEDKIEELMILRVLEGVNTSAPLQKRISALKVNLLWDVNRILLATGLDVGLYRTLFSENNDEYIQKNILRHFQEVSSDARIISALERFSRYYLSNFVIELVKKDQVVTFEFAQLLLGNGVVTPNADIRLPH